MKQRTKTFALRVLKLIDSLPETRSGRVLANQLGRSGTPVGANDRAACRSRSTAEMISRFAVVEEEADESAFWIEPVGAHGLVPMENLNPLLVETDELTAMMVSSRRTLQRSVLKSKIDNPKSIIR
ncbi:MAG: four helix bundle protein [Opitutaceae bacterium]